MSTIVKRHVQIGDDHFFVLSATKDQQADDDRTIEELARKCQQHLRESAEALNKTYDLIQAICRESYRENARLRERVNALGDANGD